MLLEPAPARELALCHGYRVATEDGIVGEVDTPIFPPDVAEPDYLIVRIRHGAELRLPVVATSLVAEVNQERRLVFLRGTREEIARLPEHLPLATCSA